MYVGHIAECFFDSWPYIFPIEPSKTTAKRRNGNGCYCSPLNLLPLTHTQLTTLTRASTTAVSRSTDIRSIMTSRQNELRTLRTEHLERWTTRYVQQGEERSDTYLSNCVRNKCLMRYSNMARDH